MASYRYQRGDRPLEGYTIEHAVGRGGFGEVYYAVSDSGKQVALKAVQNYEDIELRGSTHCMNIKSPHLVTIFDVRHSERGDPFVIMEYVAGPSLRELLDHSPEGLGPEKAAWFIREIAKAVSLLHDNGIVHRDLKPHNVFFEDGYVMIGDYSLSKVITTSHRSGHTLTVGTVHYMAPEISLGRYDRTVDIYAMGVLLYEMLTGRPPFLGESMGEVLMKHMTQEVDVSTLPQPFASVVQKATARDPEERYQTADDLVEALFGSDAVRNGASGFDPGSLTVIARRAVQGSRSLPATVARDSDSPVMSLRQNTADGKNAAPTDEKSAARHTDRQPFRKTRSDSVPFWIGQFLSRITARLALRPYPANAVLWERFDEMGFGIRSTLAATVLFLGSLGIIYFGQATGQPLISSGPKQFYLTPLLAVAVTTGTTAAGWLLAFFRLSLPWYVIRGLFCFSIGVMFFAYSILDFELANDPASLGPEFLITLIMPAVLMDWRWLTSSRRRCRISIVPSLAAMVISLIAALNVLDSDGQTIGAVALATTAAMATQLLMPFSESRSRRVQEATDWMASLDGLAECIAKDQQVHDEESVGFGTAPSNSNQDAAADSDRSDPATHELSWREDSSGSNQASYPMRTSGQASSTSSDPGESSDLDSTTLTPSRARMPALVLSLVPLIMMPMFGLQRFYVGKVFSGTLYLATLGLFGIGQLIDVILIALGEFRDAEGRLLIAWRSGTEETPTAGEQVNSLSVVPSPRTMFSDGLALMGGLSLAGTVVLGLMLAVDLPEMIAADLFRELGMTSADMQSSFGTQSWPELMRELMQLALGIMAVATAGLLVASRRSTGFAHLVRVPVTFLPLGGAFAILMEAFYRVSWGRVANEIHQGKIGPVLEEFLRSNDFIPSLIGAAVAFAAGLLILSWPARQRDFAATEPVRTPVAQGR